MYLHHLILQDWLNNFINLFSSALYKNWLLKNLLFHSIGLHHPLDGITNHKYDLLRFLTTICFSREYWRGKNHCTIDHLFDWFGLVCFANKNTNCQLSYSWFQTSQTGGQRYSDTSPFSIPWFLQNEEGTSFYQDMCCHLALWLQLILFHLG